MKLRHTVICSLSIITAGCTSVPLGSLYSLSRIKFESTDVRQLRVAVTMPREVRTKPQGVAMDADVKLAGRTSKTSFRLDETRDGADRVGLPPPPAEQATHIYKMNDVDRTRFETIRAELLAHKAKGESGTLGLGIAAKEFCLSGPLPSGPIALTISLKTSETREYVVASRLKDARKEAELAAALASLQPCEPER